VLLTPKDGGDQQEVSKILAFLVAAFGHGGKSANPSRLESALLKSVSDADVSVVIFSP
jgi:hypothetical protein